MTDEEKNNYIAMVHGMAQKSTGEECVALNVLLAEYDRLSANEKRQEEALDYLKDVYKRQAESLDQLYIDSLKERGKLIDD